MKEIYQKYIDNLDEGHALVKKNLLLSGMDRDTLLSEIRENSRRAYELRCENDAILRDILHSRTAEDLTEEDVEDLKEFADELFVFSHQNDVGTAYRVHQLLYKYAELKGDLDLRVRQLYHMGAALFYMNPVMVELGVNLYGKKVTEYFTDGAAFFDRCEELDNPQTKGYSLRCLTNLCITDERFTCRHQPCIPYNNIESFHEYKKYFNAMLELYQSPYYREMYPEFNWEHAIYNLHFNLSLYYQFIQPYHDPEIIQDILESAKYIYSHQEQIPTFRYSTKEMRVAQIYAAARWKAGLISSAEMADEIYALIESADENDFSLNGITQNLQMPLHFEYAYRCMNRSDRIAYREKMRIIDKRVQAYLLKAPHNEYSNLISQSVAESIRYRAQHNLPLHRKFFDALLFCHPPTYIHVCMTARLSRRIFARMVEVAPERLLGLFDIYDVGELRSRREELAERIYHCALYHDVGKIMLLDYVGIYDRTILDEEFAAIKLHTSIGSALLERTDPKELSVVALHHHRFYNEMGGYPEKCSPCPTQYKPFVDIVTVADSIEAATDSIGRCYSVAKSFPALVEELRRDAGTRYSPHVVALFDDENFFARVERELRYRREAIYFETYGNNQKEFFMSPGQL